MSKILIVDDDKPLAETLAQRLRAQGHESAIASNARQALMIIRASKFDLVVAEILVPPGSSGMDLLRFIQLEMPETAVVMMSAAASIETAVEAMQLGAIDFMPKPLDLEKVAERIKGLLDRHKQLLETRHYQVYMERTFRRYISPEVLTVLMSTREIENLQARQLEVSVLFCDLRDFTALSKSWDPPALIPLLNTYYFQPATEIISAHKGTIDKFIGDGVMAVFGAPLPVEDHARLALRACLDLERKVEADRVAGRHPFRVGIGMASGIVTSGNLGGPQRLDFTVLGPAVNRAARLEKLAGPGEICLDETTLALVSPLDVPVHQERAEVKGEGADLTVFKLTPIRKPI